MNNDGSNEGPSPALINPLEVSSSSPSSHHSIGKWTAENIEKRLSERKQRQSQYKELLESLKEKGNSHFKNGDYEEAAEEYASILLNYGYKFNVLSNYAATLLKLEEYGQAEAVATEGLKLDPQNLKLRFRRAMARKNMRRYNPALIDLQTVLSADPVCAEALQEHHTVLAILQHLGPDFRDPEPVQTLIVADPAFPPLDKPGYPDEEAESDSEDFVHVGNGIGCRKYNRGLCTDGPDCTYSHAGDHRSQRDKLGRNICNYYLFGKCELSDEDCPYLHDKLHLPDGWWNNEQAVNYAVSLFANEDLEPHHLKEALNATLATLGKPREYPNYRKYDRNLRSKSWAGSPTGDNQTQSLPPRSGFVMVLALYDDIEYEYKWPTLNAINDKILVKLARTKREALRYLDEPDLQGVFIADSGIQKRKKADLLARLVKYTRGGGRVVICGSFSEQISPNAMDNIFQNSWGVPWKFGEYFRTTFSINIANELVRENPQLPESYSMKAVHLKDVPITHAAYYAIQDARLESHVFPPYLMTNRNETPAAFAKIDNGYLGYVGDVNWEKGSEKVILAMLDLLQAPFRPDAQPLVIPRPAPPAFTFNGECFLEPEAYLDWSDQGAGADGDKHDEDFDDDEDDDDDDEDDY